MPVSILAAYEEKSKTLKIRIIGYRNNEFYSNCDYGCFIATVKKVKTFDTFFFFVRKVVANVTETEIIFLEGFQVV